MIKERKLNFLNMLFITAVVASNIMATKLFNLFGIAMPAGVIVFPISFLVTDVINEVWGKNEANNTVKLGFISNLLFTLFIYISIILPPFKFWELQTEFKMVLGSVPRITFAGLASFIVSQTLDVNTFHKLKVKHDGKKLWIRNNVSTITSQLVDSFLFIFIAFAGTMPFLEILKTVFMQWLVKAVLALLDTPFCYAMVRWAKEG